MLYSYYSYQIYTKDLYECLLFNQLVISFKTKGAQTHGLKDN